MCLQNIKTMENQFEQHFFEAIGKMKKEALKNGLDTLDNTNIGKSLKTFSIITAENPKGEKLQRAENEIRMSELKKALEQERILFISQKRGYKTDENPDGAENSLILINAQSFVAESLCLKFQQKSFIHCKCENNKITSCYYETKDYKSYKLLETIINPINNIEETDDCHSMCIFNHNQIKYTISFKLFEDIADFIADSMNISLNEYDVRLNEESIRIAAFGCGSSRYYRNMTMYKAIQENIKRHLSNK